MFTQQQAATKKMIFRKTNANVGRNIFITPANSSMLHLAYARILLNSSRSKESFSTANRETGLICLSGQAAVAVDQKDIELKRYDAIYVPRDSSVAITTRTSADLAEFSTDVDNVYPLQVVRYEEIAKDPGLKFSTGGQSCARHLNMLLAKNIEAGRLIVGFTQAEPGNWTSWPPYDGGRDVRLL
jgi:5-deoxy-glucuronate isomerase